MIKKTIRNKVIDIKNRRVKIIEIMKELDIIKNNSNIQSDDDYD